MPTIENSDIRVELDERWPRTVRLTRLENGAAVAGCSVSTQMLREGGPVRIARVQEPSSRTSRRR